MIDRNLCVDFFLSVFFRSAPHVSLEIFGESGLVGKPEFVGYLLQVVVVFL